MSPELVAALVGAVTGGIIALLGSIAQVITQGWMSERGKITCDVAAWRFRFTYGFWPSREDSERDDRRSRITEADVPWEVASTCTAAPSPADSLELVRKFEPYYADSGPLYAHVRSAHFSFTGNFLNTKGTNAAVLEYSVRFFKGKQTLLTLIPEIPALHSGQALALPAENVTGFYMSRSLWNEELELILREADSVAFTARLSSGHAIRMELQHLSQDSKGARKGSAT